MNHTNSNSNSDNILKEISDFIISSSGLKLSSDEYNSKGLLNVFQKTDNKQFNLQISDIEEVIQRMDYDGKSFKQINFKTGQKILLTDSLVGFKPGIITGLDLSRLPKVVTTPDLYSVLDAIQDVLSSEAGQEVEVEILRKVFQSIILGASKVGFDMTEEKKILESLPFAKTKMAA